MSASARPATTNSPRRTRVASDIRQHKRDQVVVVGRRRGQFRPTLAVPAAETIVPTSALPSVALLPRNNLASVTASGSPQPDGKRVAVRKWHATSSSPRAGAVRSPGGYYGDEATVRERLGRRTKRYEWQLRDQPLLTEC